VSGSPAPVRLRDLKTGAVTPCAVGRPVVIGRADPSSAADVRCADPHVSRRHCRVEAGADGDLRIVDLSSYGTFVNGVRLEGEGRARPGDRVVLGHDYTFAVEAEDPATVAWRGPAASGGAGTGQAATRARPTAGDPADDPAAGSTRTAPDPRYDLQRVIGRGAMGVVYLAQDGERRRPCAVKVLKVFAGPADREVEERFRREAMLAHALGDYPGIVQVYDLGTTPASGELYYAMDYVDGESLHDWLQRRPPPPRRAAVWVVAQVARAVAYAHERGVIHRDLKPANVLVTPAGTVHLTDFGVAKALDDGGGMTATGIVLGTPQYMAPEQIADSKRAGRLADVYALGAILYEALAGRPPYDGTKVGAVLRKVQKGDRSRLVDLVPDVDPALADLVERALDHDPGQRPRSAQEVADALEAGL